MAEKIREKIRQSEQFYRTLPYNGYSEAVRDAACMFLAVIQNTPIDREPIEEGRLVAMQLRSGQWRLGKIGAYEKDQYEVLDYYNSFIEVVDPGRVRVIPYCTPKVKQGDIVLAVYPRSHIFEPATILGLKEDAFILGFKKDSRGVARVVQSGFIAHLNHFSSAWWAQHTMSCLLSKEYREGYITIIW